MSIEHLRADYLINRYVHLPRVPLIHSDVASTILTFLIIVTSILFLFLILRRCLSIRSILTEKSILLELTPPASTEKTAYTTQQLFSVIHNLGRQLSVIDKFWGKKNRYSFEIVSTKQDGIRYLIQNYENNIWQKVE